MKSPYRPHEVMLVEFNADGSSRCRLWQLHSDDLVNQVAFLLDSEVGSAVVDSVQSADEADRVRPDLDHQP